VESTLIGEILARLILAYILASQKYLDIFWIYFSESPFWKISRGLIFSEYPSEKILCGLIFVNAMILKKKKLKYKW